LRAATSGENARNRKKIENRSGEKGVKWHATNQRWEGEIVREGKTVWRKQFKTVEDAAAARAGVLPLYHGLFARVA